VRQQHRFDGQLREQRQHFLQTQPRGLELGERIHHAPGLWPLAVLLKICPPAPDAVHPFGHVHQLEPGGEGPHQLARDARRATAHPHRERLGGTGHPFAPADRGQPVLFDQLPELRTALLAQHLIHELRERTDVFPQRMVARRELDVFVIHGGRNSTCKRGRQRVPLYPASNTASACSSASGTP
jgi:hypothetical protein